MLQNITPFPAQVFPLTAHPLHFAISFDGNGQWAALAQAAIPVDNAASPDL